MYNQDSLFTLSIMGQIGLLALSLLILALLLWIMTRITGH